jgi:hypothetical protein
MGTKGRFNYSKIVEFMVMPVAIKSIMFICVYVYVKLYKLKYEHTADITKFRNS